MVQASAAACMASAGVHVSDDQGEEEEFPPERDVSMEEPRLGVFVCDCGTNIGGLIDVSLLVRYAQGLPQVVVSEMVGRGCSRESLEHIQEVILERGLNRVVIGACSPRTHETLFQDTVRKAGSTSIWLKWPTSRSGYMGSWIDPEEALNKAKDLLRMAVSV
jgi:heterodisulfide reductase subunit A2